MKLIVKKLLFKLKTKKTSKYKNYFLNNVNIPATSKNSALITLTWSAPTITNIVAIKNPIPANSSFFVR